LLMACLKHEPSKVKDKFNALHGIINVKAIVMIPKLVSSSMT